MGHKNKKRLFRLCRTCFRFFTRRYHVSSGYTEPAVYVVHHQNMKGPVTCMAWMDMPLIPWVLHVFCDKRACFRQYYDYTFTRRFGLPKAVAAIIVLPLSSFVSRLMKSMQAIPVFRGSINIIKTFRLSFSALNKGKSLLICPDIDYASTDTAMGQMYDGFLNLEKYYFREKGRHLGFIPLHISDRDSCIYAGKTVYFNNCGDFRTEKSKVYDRIRREFLRLESRDMQNASEQE